MAISRLLIVLSSLSAIFSSTSLSAKTFYGFGREVDSYIREAAQRYQVSEAMLRGLVKMEDGWYGKISPTGAVGVGQFTFKTWNELAQLPEGYRIGMRPITARTKGTYADPRRHRYINTLAMGLYVRWIINQFAERGLKATDENVYLAYNIGLDGFHRAVSGRITWNDLKNMRRNGMTRSMRVSDFLAYQKGRYLENKRIANFQRAVPSQTFASTSSRRNVATLQPNIPSPQVMRWIEPADKLRWVNPL